MGPHMRACTCYCTPFAAEAGAASKPKKRHIDPFETVPAHLSLFPPRRVIMRIHVCMRPVACCLAV